MADSAQTHGRMRPPEESAVISLATRELDTGEARTRWSDTLRQLYGEMDVAWSNRADAFGGRWAGRPFGDLHISTIHAERTHTVVRSPAMIRSDEGHDYMVIMVTTGPVEVSQSGRTAVVDHGSFVVLDCSIPFRYQSSQELNQVVVSAPRQLLAARLPEYAINEITARAMTGTCGAGKLVAGVLKGIASLDDDLSPGSAVALSSATLDMLATAVAETPIPMRATAAARNQDLLVVKRALQRSLHNADYTLGDLASEVGMSTRYIQKLFAAAASTPRTWLQQLRIEKARSQLLTTDLTVAEVAAQVGFRDVSHFSRSFRAQFGISPGQYRSGSRAHSRD